MKRAAMLWISTLLLLLHAPRSGFAGDREVLLGTIYKDNAYAVPKLSSEKPRTFPEVTLLHGPLQVNPDNLYAPKRYRFSQCVIDNHPYRWRVVRDIFWGSGTAGARTSGTAVLRIPLEDLPLVDPSNAKRKEQYKAKFPDDRDYESNGENALTWGADMVRYVCYRHPLAPGDDWNPSLEKPPIPTPGVYFDVYPAADNRLLLFVIDGDMLRVWSGIAKRGGFFYWKMDWGTPAEEVNIYKSAVDSFKSPMKEPFTVFVRDKDYYFVTESGTIYLARNPGEKKGRKVEKVWDGEQKSVCALITDASNDKVYCFVEPVGKDKKDENRVYFELAAKPDPKPYKLAKIEKPKIAEPLKSVLEYAQVLKNDKKIK